MKYFDLFGIGPTKHILFHYSTFYAGLALTYQIVLSFCGAIFSIFIYTKKGEFIGSQFAINYILKLARLNYFSTLGLLIISFVPWAMLELFKFL
ncbi:MAG: hypothetical protein HND50_02215 [Calditrichaeota bacterium]|nr:hypothetical protein [Calditrichota bacterium]